MNDSPKCFISYCSDDVPKNAIEEMIYAIKIASKSGIEIFYDKDYNDPGNDLKAFMDNILICDSVVVVCSPKYKEKHTKKNTNVKYEFDLIKKRIKK